MSEDGAKPSAVPHQNINYMYGSQENVSSSSKSFGRCIIEWAAFLLSSSVNGIYSELSELPTSLYTNPKLSVEENAQILVNKIRKIRNAKSKINLTQ